MRPPTAATGAFEGGLERKGSCGKWRQSWGAPVRGLGPGAFRRRCLACLAPLSGPPPGSAAQSLQVWRLWGHRGVLGAFQARKLGRFPDQLFCRHHLPVSFLLRGRGLPTPPGPCCTPLFQPLGVWSRALA